MQKIIHSSAVSYYIVAVAVLTRFIPHLPDFSPVFGALLFGGATLHKRDAIWYPVSLLALSDLALTVFVYHMPISPSQLIVWAAFACVALIGSLLRTRITTRNVFMAALAGPVVFFLISNFAVWLEGQVYPMTMTGLSACFVAALPFFQNSLLSSLLSSFVLFALHAQLQKQAAMKAVEVR